jgi:hypothetical protein
MVIPLAAVGKLEVSRGRRHSRGLATAVGIAAGFGGFMAGGWLGVALCGSLDCDIAPLTGFALGAVLGGFTGRRLGAERWEPTTPAALRAGFQAIRD